MMPTGGQIVGFLAGIGLGYFLGSGFAIWASSTASAFFSSLGLILGTAFGIVLLVMLAFLFIKAWYFLAPFVIGVVCGLILNSFLGSPFYNSLTSSVIVMCA